MLLPLVERARRRTGPPQPQVLAALPEETKARMLLGLLALDRGLVVVVVVRVRRRLVAGEVTPVAAQAAAAERLR
jgi:hypothetical protein